MVVSSVLWSGIVPTEGEIVREGYGSDPAQWVSAKERRKAKKQSLGDYLAARNAAGARAMILKGTTRMASTKYKTGAAFVMLAIGKLSAMSFDQGMPDLLLDYLEEHVEAHKGEGLFSAENPLDPSILTDTVLCRKLPRSTDGTGASTDDTSAKVDRTLSKIKELEDSIRATDLAARSRLSEVSALQRHVDKLERELASGITKKKGPPSVDNPCSFCQAPDHFSRDCPKRTDAAKKRADKRIADAEALANDADEDN